MKVEKTETDFTVMASQVIIQIDDVNKSTDEDCAYNNIPLIIVQDDGDCAINNLTTIIVQQQQKLTKNLNLFVSNANRDAEEKRKLKKG